MVTTYTRRQFASSLVGGMLGASVSGCGTILYPERRGQPSGRLDWGVVALDGIGLLFFFIPGVIAFAVDFITGAIYLPYDGYGSVDHGKPRQLRRIDVPRQSLTPDGIAHVIREATGHTISLNGEECETRRLKNLEDFWTTRDKFVAA